MKARVTSGLDRGFTIVELLVVISIIALLVGILLPAIGKARDAALTTQSSANMRNLSAAHAAYSADWSDRQWTACPDDVGLYAGGAADPLSICNNYVAAGGCPPQLVLGWDANTIQTIWGYFLGCGSTDVGSCGAFGVYMPINLVTGDGTYGYGSFRLNNVESFNSYLNGRFYDPVFYAPKDSLILSGAEKYFALPDEFTVVPPDGEGNPPSPTIWNTSYCLSPAAMWAPDVFGLNKQTNQYWTDPSTLPAGYKSPAAGQATYPDLKTRMLEHNWLQQKPNSDVNYGFVGNWTPWYFNHGFNSAPVTMFYDGHVQVVGCGDAMDADSRQKKAAQNPIPAVGLWSPHTPMGTNGYYMDRSYDFTVDTSFHILTVDGIQGRDVLGVK
jgi:prepilin-type N-terminal cleavage/methylation domain-containing protein